MKKLAILTLVLFLSACSSTVEVSFNGEEIENIVGAQGDLVELPQLTRTGFDFLGWYLDESLTLEVPNRFTIPETNVVLYPRWVKIITVGFGGEARNFDDLTGYEGSSLRLPNVNPPEGFVFDGWYSDSQLNTRFEQVVFGDRDLVLYPKLVREIDFLIDYVERNFPGTIPEVNFEGVRFITFSPEERLDISDTESFLSITIYEDNKITIIYSSDITTGVNSILMITTFEYGSRGNFSLIASFNGPGGVVTGASSTARYNFSTGVSSVGNLRMTGLAEREVWIDLLNSVVEVIIAPELVILLEDAGLPIK
jgi:uncharacterized repeat protein (TIGR02543 family)